MGCCTYEPFGRLLGQWGPLADANLYRFSSKEAHVNSGLTYYLYRYYEPGLQRWLNRDPIGEIGSSLLSENPMIGMGKMFKLTQELVGNPFAFDGNAPNNLIDSDGRVALVPVIIGIGIGGAFAVFAYQCHEAMKNDCNKQCGSKGVKSAKVHDGTFGFKWSGGTLGITMACGWDCECNCP